MALFNLKNIEGDDTEDTPVFTFSPKKNIQETPGVNDVAEKEATSLFERFKDKINTPAGQAIKSGITSVVAPKINAVKQVFNLPKFINPILEKPRNIDQNKVEAYKKASNLGIVPPVQQNVDQNFEYRKSLEEGTGKVASTNVGVGISQGTRGTRIVAPYAAAYNYLSGKESGDYLDVYNKTIQNIDKKMQDPTNSFGENFLYSFSDSVPQTLVGSALSLIPVIGKPLSTAFFGLVSAENQMRDTGKVSAPNVIIDTVGDRILGANIEKLLATPTQELIKSGMWGYVKRQGKQGLVEGVTEPSQTILKYVSDYKDAKTPEQKQAVLTEAKDYVLKGGLLMESLVGFSAGFLISGGVESLNTQQKKKMEETIKNIHPDKDSEFTDPQNKVRKAFRQQVLYALTKNNWNTEKASQEISNDTGINIEVAQKMISELSQNSEFLFSIMKDTADQFINPQENVYTEQLNEIAQEVSPQFNRKPEETNTPESPDTSFMEEKVTVYSGSDKEKGSRYFTGDEEYAKVYAGPKGKVQKIDIPKSEIFDTRKPEDLAIFKEVLPNARFDSKSGLPISDGDAKTLENALSEKGYKYGAIAYSENVGTPDDVSYFVTKDFYNKATGKESSQVQEPSFNKKETNETQKIKLPVTKANLAHAQEIIDRLGLKGVNAEVVATIFTDDGNRAYGVMLPGNIAFEEWVQKYTEYHEIQHIIWNNLDRISLFKKAGITQEVLTEEGKEIWGEDADINEELSKGLQQYIAQRESNQPTTFTGKIRDFFSKVYDMLQNIFKNKSAIEKYYQTIYKGKATEPTFTRQMTAGQTRLFNRQVAEGKLDFRTQEYIQELNKRGVETIDQYLKNIDENTTGVFDRTPQPIAIVRKDIANVLGGDTISLSEFVVAKIKGKISALVGHPEITDQMIKDLPERLNNPIEILKDGDKKYFFINEDPQTRAIVEIGKNADGSIEISTYHRIGDKSQKQLGKNFPTVYSVLAETAIPRIDSDTQRVQAGGISSPQADNTIPQKNEISQAPIFNKKQQFDEDGEPIIQLDEEEVIEPTPKNPPVATAQEALELAEKRVGVKPVNREKLEKKLARVEMSLLAYERNPQAHTKAYGTDKKQENLDQIDSLEKQLMVSDYQKPEPQEVDLKDMIAQQIVDAEMQIENAESALVNTGIDQGIYDEMTNLAENDSFNPRSGFRGQTSDTYRHIKNFFGKHFNEFQKNFWSPWLQAKKENAQEEIDLKNELYQKITKELGIKKGSPESEAIMNYGERNLEGEFAPPNPETKESLLSKFGKEKTDNIIKADAWFREKYNNLIDRVNAERKKIYGAVWAKKANLDEEIALVEKLIKNQKIEMSKKKKKDTITYLKLKRNLRRYYAMLQQRKDLLDSDEWWRGKIIPKRNDYYRHWQELTDGFAALKNIIQSESNIPTNLAGISPTTKPKSRFLKFAQERIGNKTNRDAIGGFLEYIPTATYAIHIDKHIERFRKIAEALARSKNKAYSPMIEYFHDLANNLSGKTEGIDRYFQKLTGRKFFRVLNWFNSRVKANAILGNTRSALSQLLSLPAAIAKTKTFFIKGMGSSIKNIFNKETVYNPSKNSGFYIERYKGKADNQFRESLLEKPKLFAEWMIESLDRASVTTTLYSLYEQGKSKGVENPVEYADIEAGKIFAGRGIGDTPLLNNSKVFQMIAPFQLEVGNLWRIMKDFVDEKEFGSLVILFILSHFMAKLYREITGSDGIFDPIQAFFDGLQSAKSETMQGNYGKALALFAGRVGGEVLSNLPFGQSLAGMYPEKGIGGITRKELFGEGDPTRYGSTILLVDALKQPQYTILPPWGGAQLRKTYQGIKSLSESSSESSLGEKTKATLFGKSYNYGTPEYTLDQSIRTETTKAQKELDALDDDIAEAGIKAWEEVKDLPEDDARVSETLDLMTDLEYEAYKKAKKADEQYQQELYKKVVPVVDKIMELGVDDPKTDEMINSLTDEEYEAYKKAKKALYGVDIDVPEAKVLKEGEKQFGPSTDREVYDKQNIITKIWNGAQALGTDPVDFFDALIHGGYEFMGTKGGQLIIARMKEEDSEAIKKAGGVTSSNKSEWRLDHIVPLTAGGLNKRSNLQLIPTSQWSSNTALEVAIGRALYEKKINGREAREYIIRYKAGKGQKLSQETLKEYKKKYKSQPLTEEQVLELIAK